MGRILITGAAGLIGGIIRQRLAGEHALSALDLRPIGGQPSTVADYTDLAAIASAFERQDAIVHLAADPDPGEPWHSTLGRNVVGTHNVFEAASRAGVRRVVFASSISVMAGYLDDPPWRQITEGRFERLEPGYPLITERMPVRPVGYYGASKLAGESIGRFYFDAYGLSSIHLRIGWVMPDDDPTFSPYALATWLSHRDVAQIVERALAAPDSLGYGVFNATSDNRWKVMSLDRAREQLGYAPDDDAGDQWRERPAGE